MVKADEVDDDDELLSFESSLNCLFSDLAVVVSVVVVIVIVVVVVAIIVVVVIVVIVIVVVVIVVANTVVVVVIVNHHSLAMRFAIFQVSCVGPVFGPRNKH